MIESISQHLTIAFRPVVTAGSAHPFAWQARASTVRGRSFSAAAASVPLALRPALEARRITLAIERAAADGLRDSDALLALPIGAVAGNAEELLSHLFRTALAHRFPTERLMIEINADERGDVTHAAALAQACTARGIAVALEGFAAGPVALNLLSRFTPDCIKLAPALVRNIDTSLSRRLIVEGVMRLARSMGVAVIGCGADSRAERTALVTCGVRMFQLDHAGSPVNPRMRRPVRDGISPAHRRLAHHQRVAAPMRPAADAVAAAV